MFITYVCFWSFHPAIAHAVSRCASLMAKPTHSMYAACKRILAWLRDRIDLGVTYGASHLRSAEDLLPQGPPKPPMDPSRDASLACSVDSDLACATMRALTDLHRLHNTLEEQRHRRAPLVVDEADDADLG